MDELLPVTVPWLYGRIPYTVRCEALHEILWRYFLRQESILMLSRNNSNRAPVLGTCQIDKGNSHKQRSTECMGFGEAISNVTLEPKP